MNFLMSRSHRSVVFVAAALAASACSAGRNNSDSSDGGGDGSGGADDGGGTTSFNPDGGAGAGFEGGGDMGGGGPGDDCSEAAKLVYIIGSGNNLYSFHPPTLAVTPIGVINCPQNGGFGSPFSMAVDRTGRAWVLFNDGKIYHVDTATAACTGTPYTAGQQGLFTFGMGFVSDEVGSAEETLYVADYQGSGIASISTDYVLSPVLGYDAIYTAAELTGTGDSRLFGFFQGNPIIIAEIDKNTGSILSQAPQPTINIGSGWAFAFWGGDFWTFTNPGGGGSQIDRYQPATGMTSTVLTGIGDNIVGAGVSTCAPTEPPQ